MINRIILSGKKELVLRGRALIMGILNLTPDSFSDGGQCLTPESALIKARQLVADGADILDLGAESTRPGAVQLSPAKEQSRLLPALDLISRELSVPLSVDTYHPETAEQAILHGADIINDINGLQDQYEPGAMAQIAAKYKAPVICMHNQDLTEITGDLCEEIRRYFKQSIAIAARAGIAKDKLILDPGIGFGKTSGQCLEILQNLSELLLIDNTAYPLLLGVSRKSFIGKTLDLPLPERLEATGAACLWGLSHGATILRVHDVKEIKRMVKMWEAIKYYKPESNS